MKPIKHITVFLLLSMAIFSCKKEFPENDNPYSQDCDGCPTYFTNKYILTSINAGLYKKNTIGQHVTDTVMYNEFYINLDLSGQIISENVAYIEAINTTPNPYIGIYEQKYFVNKVVTFDVIPNCIYNDSISPNNQGFKKFVTILFRNKIQQYFNNSYPYYINSELGYAPIKIEISAPPDTSKWVSFTVKITDDKGNVFTSSTDSIFVTK